MKQIFIFLVVFFTGITVRADFVIQQKMESAMQNGDMTLKFKGNEVRVDMTAGPAGDISTILDLDTGDSTTLMHQQKMAMKMPAAQLKQMMERMRSQNGNTNATPPKLVDTGKTETVGGYDSEIYTWTNNRDSGGTVWVANKFPDYAKIKIQLDRLEKSPVSQMAKGLAPDTSTLPGMVMRSTAELQGQKVTTTFISAKEAPVDASTFQIPTDYQLMSVPEMPGKPTGDAMPPQ